MTAPTLLDALLRPMSDPDFEAIPFELASRSFDRSTPYQERIARTQIVAAQVGIWRVAMTLKALFETYPYIQVVDLEWMIKGRVEDQKVSLYSRINPADPVGPKNFDIDQDTPPDWAMEKDQAKVFRKVFYEWWDVYVLAMGQPALQMINQAYKKPVKASMIDDILNQWCPDVLTLIDRISLKQDTITLAQEQELLFNRL